MDYYSYYNALNYRQNQKLILDIEKAINGEYTAVQCYEKIAQMAPSETVKKQILEIQQDELSHFQAFSQIYMRLTGKQPQPQLVEECPTTFQEGLEIAFLDEQKTVDLYLEIAQESNNPTIKKAFKNAAAQEQNHAVWFLYFMNKGL